MTKIIAHRANLSGPTANENQIESIEKTIELGFDAEVDVWFVDQKLYLGHDKPQYEIDVQFFLEKAASLWIHCKNVESLIELSKYDSLNIFWHQQDDFVLTRSNHIWTYPGKKITNFSIDVMPIDLKQSFLMMPYGICTDYPIDALEVRNHLLNNNLIKDGKI